MFPFRSKKRINRRLLAIQEGGHRQELPMDLVSQTFIASLSSPGNALGNCIEDLIRIANSIENPIEITINIQIPSDSARITLQQHPKSPRRF